MSNRLTEIVRSEFGSVEEPLWFGSTDDYRQFAAPRWMRHLSSLEGQHIFHKKLQSYGRQLPRIVIACTLEVAAAIMAFDSEVLLVVATDSTPHFRARLDRIVGIAAWKHSIKSVINVALQRHYNRLIRHIRAWLPMSETCKQSLVQDYGVSPDACFVTRAPQLDIAATPPARCMSQGFRVLMVGNDFVRKGGRALVDAVNSLDCVTLTIISNDAIAKSVAHPGKIDVVSGLTNPEDIRPYYRAAHLLVHPTRSDCYAHVMCEALSQGCPVAVTEGLPPAEIVDESGAGWLIPNPVNSRSIASLIASVKSQPDEIDRRAEAAIQYAQSRLSMGQFGTAVRGSVTYALRKTC